MTSDPRDYRLDIRSVELKDVPDFTRAIAPTSKPFLSVLFKCCSVYQRVYKNPTEDRYDARCPRCGKFVRFVVGAGGSDQREFVVD
ncbi:MAG TPA: hypothetical protein PK402_09560 [Tepidisphaeraceae bacterium]|nr:hypothetical protein [Tepidisphaeraceae bacterium]